MEKNLSDLLPVWEVTDDCIVSAMGDYTVGFALLKPEIFTLSTGNYDALHQALVRALRIMPAPLVLHMQDWYVQKRWRGNSENGKSFLSASSDRFFKGRSYLDHRCWLFLTKKPAGRMPASSGLSGLLRRKLVPEETLDKTAIAEFMDHVGPFERILADSGLIQLRRLTTEELISHPGQAGVIEQYCYLNPVKGRPVIRDINFDQGIRVGDRHCLLYTLSDTEQLPGTCSAGVPFEKYSTDRTEFPIGFGAAIGGLLACNHIVNQYIVLDDARAVLRKLETKRTRLQSLSNHARENGVARDAVNDFLNEAATHQRLPVKVHVDVLAWTEDAGELPELKNKVSAAMARLGAIPHLETVGAAQLWWAGIPGNAGDLPVNECFDTFLEQACCFLIQESSYRSSPDGTGIRFGDRLTGKPVELDLFFGPLENSVITNRGMFICGSSGGGKSMLCNHIYRTLYDQGAHVVIVDIGGSYKGLCELVGGFYFTYTETDPICFNPFYLSAGESLDTEKKESLKALLVTLWKEEHESFNRTEYVALSNALQGYYAKLDQNPDIFPCFNTFYEYLERDYVELLQEQHVKDSNFDIGNFLYVLKPYYRGGEFDYLLNATNNLDMLKERLVIFELDKIKDHAILLPVVALVITELVVSKMQKISSSLKAFVIEEAWKPMMRAGMAQFVRYSFKTLRKLNGIPCVVTQEIDDLISSPIIKEAIIGNSDIKILMDMRKFINKFDPLQATLGMSDKGKVQLFSVNRANEPGRRYREFYLELGGQQMKVLRYEPSPEEYWVYTTNPKEKAKVMEYAERYGGMEKGVKALVREINSIRG